MGQIHPGFIADMLKHCERGEHPPLTVWEAQQLLTLAQRALAASPAPAPQEPAARFLLVAMDDDGCGNPVFCADEKAVRDALAPLLFFFNDKHPLDAENEASIDAHLESLLEDGFLNFEGDPGITLYKLHASPAPGELGAVDASAVDAASAFARLLREEAAALRREGEGCADGRYEWMAAGVEAAADTLLGIDSATGKTVIADVLNAMAQQAPSESSAQAREQDQQTAQAAGSTQTGESKEGGQK